jgi:hypothetical protein
MISFIEQKVSIICQHWQGAFGFSHEAQSTAWTFIACTLLLLALDQKHQLMKQRHPLSHVPFALCSHIQTSISIFAMSNTIYEGLWTDWSKGRWAGATVTLSQHNGVLLLAFIATFVTLVMMRLWRICSFVCHQVCATEDACDALRYQRQHTFRNASSPAVAARIFVLQIWYWRHGKGMIRRTLPWAAFAMFYVCAATALALFSSRISDNGSSLRLLRSNDCGIWDWEWIPSDDSDVELSNFAIRQATLDAEVAYGYAKSCYTAETRNVRCRSYATPMIKSIARAAECPFSDDICFDERAFEVSTDSIDSSTNLGINAQEEHRILYDRRLVCAPLLVEGHEVPYLDGDARVIGWRYYYGPNSYDPYLMLHNATMLYSVERSKANGSYYTVAKDTIGGFWEPLDSLLLDRGDTTVVFIQHNGMTHVEKNDDPVFKANISIEVPSGLLGAPAGTFITAFLPFHRVSVMACNLIHKYCTLDRQTCTSGAGFEATRAELQDENLSLSPEQRSTAIRINAATYETNIFDMVTPRRHAALQAQTVAEDTNQSPLPDNQWEHEVLFWEQASLARLQAILHEYAAGSVVQLSSRLKDRLRKVPRNDSEPNSKANQYWLSMCQAQVTRDAQGTLNFTALGLLIITTIGTLVVTLSFVLESVTAFFQRRSKIGTVRAVMWQRDESLQTLRSMFESHRRGTWQGSEKLIPTTSPADEVFFYPESAEGTVQRTYEAVSKQTSNTSSEQPRRASTC